MSDQNRPADRNLLFGILALQLDFISEEALIQAMHTWVLQKTRPLGQILREQQVLGEEDLAALETLVSRHLSKHDNDARSSLATVSVADPLRRELDHLADAELHAAMSTVSVDPPTPAP
jgi:eukaryotic-like serine/threonine-protein kinase